jgi:hypothetical protein
VTFELQRSDSPHCSEELDSRDIYKDLDEKVSVKDKAVNVACRRQVFRPLQAEIFINNYYLVIIKKGILMTPVTRARQVGRAIDNFASKQAFATLFVGATLALNGTYYTMQTTIEAVERAPKKEYVATLNNVRLYDGPISSANIHMWLGDATTPDGKKHTLNDSVRVLEGKLFGNQVLPQLKNSQQYRFTTIDSLLGEVVLRAEPSNK